MALMLFTLPILSARGSTKKAEAAAETGENTAPSALWHQPADIASRDLFFGSGGREHAPKTNTFTFVKEDLSGSNPKFTVVDADGVKWRIKLGAEAKPEIAASRFVWAAGYFTTENYFLPDLQIIGIPKHLHRGGKRIAKDGVVHNASLRRESKEESKSGDWRWKSDPFVGTREFNGLRALMSVINDWDLKDVNNAIYIARGVPERRYMVSDLGATFGTINLVPGHNRSKGNLDSYRESKFITSKTADYVNFATPGAPSLVELPNLPHYLMRIRLRWIGRHIPRADAQWAGHLLALLSPEQIRDAFRAAGYSPHEVEGFAQIVEKRIAELDAL